MIEFALVLPLLFLLIVNVVNFGGMLYAWIAVAKAARGGAQYWIMGPSSAHAPSYPSAAQVAALVTTDLSALPNAAAAQVRVCSNNNGVVTCAGAPGGSPVADPEAGLYVTGSVDVTYTYQPLIPLWNFSALGIHATLPPSNIHRRSLMRLE